MLKASFVILLGLFCHGCASSTPKPSTSVQTSKMSSTTKAIKYVSNTGCYVLNSGYMVCSKSR